MNPKNIFWINACVCGVVLLPFKYWNIDFFIFIVYLLEAQDTNGYLIQFQDKKMTEIDELNREIKAKQQRIEELEKQNN